MRLIDADKLSNDIALHLAKNAYLNDTPLDALKIVTKWIEEADEAVVRCKDCKYWERYSFQNWENFGHCEIIEYFREQNCFCSYGEKKEP